MTREELIDVILNSGNISTCPHSNCTGYREGKRFTCKECAEEVLSNYEKQIRADERNRVLSTLSLLIESDYNSKECKLLLADLCEMLVE